MCVCVFWCIVLSIAERPTRRKKAEQVEPTPSSSISIDSILIFAFENNINQFCYANKKNDRKMSLPVDGKMSLWTLFDGNTAEVSFEMEQNFQKR